MIKFKFMLLSKTEIVLIIIIKSYYLHVTKNKVVFISWHKISLLFHHHWTFCRLSRRSVVPVKFHWKTSTSSTNWGSSWRTWRQTQHWTLRLQEQSRSWKLLWRKLVHMHQMMTMIRNVE